MSNKPNQDAKTNKSDEAGYGKDAKYEVKGRRYHEKSRVKRLGRVVCVARTEMKEFPHEEKQPSGHGVTGRHQEKSGLFTININQAGTYVEAVKADIFHGDRDSKNKTRAWQARNSRPILFMWGREQSDGSFLLVPNPGQDIVDQDGKTQDASNVFNFRLVKSGSKMTLKEWTGTSPESTAISHDLISNEGDDNFDSPTYMKEVLETLPDSMSRKGARQIRMYEHAPLTKQYYRWLVRALTEETEYYAFGKTEKGSLADLIRHYAEKTPKGSKSEEKVKRQVAIRNIDHYLSYGVFPTQGPKAWHFDDLTLARLFARIILAETQISVSGSANRSYFRWLQEIVDQYARDGHGELRAVRDHLGIRPRAKGKKPRFKYTAEFDFGGLQAGWWIFGGGYFEGKVIIRQFRNSTGKKRWQKAYHGWMYVGGSNSGVAITFDPKVEGHSDADWSHRDMHGSFSVLSAEGIGDYVEIEGSGNFPFLALEKASSIGRAPSLSGATGTIEPWNSYEPNPPTPPKNNGPYFRKFGRELVLPEKIVHFRCGSAKLSDAGIRRIGLLCARELRSFRIRNNFLWVYGHADRLDKEDFNLKLSRLRAKNTLTVIKAILGKNLRAKDVYYDGFGENEAANDRQPNGVPNSKYRRVEIILGGRLVGRLYGE